MKTFIVQDGPRKSVNPSFEQMEMGIESHQHLTVEDSSQGSEFLDDAIRMHEQGLANTGANEDE